MNATSYSYYRSCVNWPEFDVDASGGLSDMVESGKKITRAYFMAQLGKGELPELARRLGYWPVGTLKMKNDYHVTYWSGRLHGQRVYWVNHSAIEYVFCPFGFLGIPA